MKLALKWCRFPFFLVTCFNFVNRADEKSQFLNRLKVLYTNCDSLTQTKQCERLNIIVEDKPDIIALTEIYPKHATFETSAAFFAIDSYDLFLTPESEGRGIAIYTKSALKATQFTTESKAKEFLWCRIKLKDQNEIVFGCIYRSPSSTSENLLYKVQRTKNTYHLYFLKESKTVFYSNTLENQHALEKAKHQTY